MTLAPTIGAERVQKRKKDPVGKKNLLCTECHVKRKSLGIIGEHIWRCIMHFYFMCLQNMVLSPNIKSY